MTGTTAHPLVASGVVYTPPVATGRLLAEDFARTHGLVIVPFPVRIKPMRYRLVWHERTHTDHAVRWLRDELIAAARALAHRAGS